LFGDGVTEQWTIGSAARLEPMATASDSVAGMPGNGEYDADNEKDDAERRQDPDPDEKPDN
jgi:hypothetical protein